MAEAAALAAIRWIASPIITKFIKRASTYLGKDVPRELEDLEAIILPQFQLVIEAAEKSPHRGKLEQWLQKLKATFHDAEDLLDEHEYDVLKREAEKGKQAPSVLASSHAILKPLHAASSKMSNLQSKNRKLLIKLDELKKILAEAKNFHDLLGLKVGNTLESKATSQIGPQTNATSLPTSKVFGRDKDRDHIIHLLCKPEDAEVSAAAFSSLAIIGLGGMGKTTLAQYVYNDQRVAKYFDTRMWVCISRKLDMHRHTQEIIESATNGECPCVSNLDTLQCKLRDLLQKSENFLLVLDDVWFDESRNEMEWEQLLAPLVSQKVGKILVTSRQKTLPAGLQCKDIISLENMEDSELLALFKEHAFSGAKVRDPLLREKLEVIAEKISQRLEKSPLAAKAVGSQLSREKNIVAWKAALNEKNLSEPMRALLWSYEKLDPRLQRCFLYCSLFPKGHKYKIDELVHLWVAEGFIDSCKPNMGIKYVGREYFKAMVTSSFFQPVYETNASTPYVMHDLLHDLAESLSREDYFRLEDDDVIEIPCNIRHLSVCVESIKSHKQSIGKLHHLRTVICIDPLLDDASYVFHQILQNLKKLRVLYLSCYNSSQLPESIGEQKHLRYLNLARTLFTELPRSLGTLYQLQTLQLNHKVKSLPDTICNLSKLHYLEGYRDRMDELIGMTLPQIPNIGKLTSLQQIPTFSVQRKKGYELGQLRDMNELGGSLKVTNLENVTGRDEALQSKLDKKSCLTKLHLAWSSENDRDADRLHLETLEGLMPPRQLKGLTIEGYKSDTYPGWLLKRSYFKNLESFGLLNCSALESLPPDAEFLRHCSELRVHNVQNLKTISCLPAGLTYLSLDRCPLLMFTTSDELERLDRNQMDKMIRIDHFASQLALFREMDSCLNRFLKEEYSSLKQLVLSMDEDISKRLQTIKAALDGERNEAVLTENTIKLWLCFHEQSIRMSARLSLVLPSGLCELHLWSCDITDGALALCLGGLTSLKKLHIRRVMTLTALPSEEVFRHLKSLDSLDITYCWCLRSSGGLKVATSLSEIRLRCCISLELARGAEFMPLSLEQLTIYNCILPANLFCSDLPNLYNLVLVGCRSLASLSIGCLTALTTLSLHELPDLCMLEGLSALKLSSVYIDEGVTLTAECISDLHVQDILSVSSSILLRMLSSDGFTVPSSLTIEGLEDPSIPFEEPAFSSVERLQFRECEMKSMPGNLKCLSSLEDLSIYNCPNISTFPDLPSSLQRLSVWGSKLLEESCQAPDGESWPKIKHIRWKEFR